MFKFVNSHGKEGRGETTWRAIVNAVGAAAAQTLTGLRDIWWQYDWPEGFDATDYVRWGGVFSDRDEFIGTMYETREFS